MIRSSMFDLTGKTAVVTGGTRGIGRAIAAEMCRHGADVVIASRHLDEGRAAAAALEAEGGRALAVACDVGRKEDCVALVEAAMAWRDRIDVLVLNAATDPHSGPLASIPDEEIDAIFRVNVKSPIWLSSLVCPRMAARKGGVVILVASAAALRGNQSYGTYAASKAACLQLVKNLTAEWGPSNVRANCLAPSLVRTGLTEPLWATEEALAESLRSYPLGRIGEPEDVAGLAVALASRAGAWMSGTSILIDGGMMAALGCRR